MIFTKNYLDSIKNIEDFRTFLDAPLPLTEECQDELTYIAITTRRAKAYKYLMNLSTNKDVREASERFFGSNGQSLIDANERYVRIMHPNRVEEFHNLTEII